MPGTGLQTRINVGHAAEERRKQCGRIRKTPKLSHSIAACFREITKPSRRLAAHFWGAPKCSRTRAGNHRECTKDSRTIAARYREVTMQSAVMRRLFGATRKHPAASH